jgi:hypothetical protein
MKTTALLVALALSVAGCATAESDGLGVLPPDVGWDSAFLLKHGEPPLWTDGALMRNRSRLRLTIDGVNRLRVIVRIDEPRAGVFEGTYLAEWKGDRRTFVRDRRSFRVPRADMERFLGEAASAGILVRPRQGWQISDDVICLDGEEVLIERVDADGYRAAGANAPCTAPPEFLLVARQIVEFADADNAMSLLQ